ncbi:hypothetical protein SK3146_03809 [Paenibacillus konkukensis]|uniref:Uncharacterized protein n=1 Tax=Paenibacillus konkukensis TaxID=2020716 RepID=A0ABY4RT24_9BACL|nr:hypothetical protein [Paenibacillus konkukensis]UQZ84554.1 hypothetical protein SK3146_03809 [Paenibacillus konkukensis]
MNNFEYVNADNLDDRQQSFVEFVEERYQAKQIFLSKLVNLLDNYLQTNHDLSLIDEAEVAKAGEDVRTN